MVDDTERLVGIVSDRDVLKALSPLDPQEAKQDTNQDGFRVRLLALGEKEPVTREAITSLCVLTRRLTTVTPETSLQDAIALLLESRISSLPVVSPDRCLCGIFTSTDVMRAMYAALRFSSKGLLGSAEPNPEMKEIPGSDA